MSWFNRAQSSQGANQLHLINKNMPPSAWKELQFKHSYILRYSEFYSTACNLLSTLAKDGKQVSLLREHAVAMLEVVLDHVEPKGDMNVIDLVQLLILILQKVVYIQVHYQDCSENEMMLDLTMKRLLALVLRLWKLCFLIEDDEGRKTENETMLLKLLCLNKRIIWNLFCTMDQYLSPNKSIQSAVSDNSLVDEKEPSCCWDDISYAIRYQNVELIDLELVYDTLRTVDWMFCFEKEQMEEVFSEAERCYMMLILRGLPTLETPVNIKGYFIHNDMTTLIPLSILSQLSTLSCFNVDDDPLERAMNFEVGGDAPSSIAVSHFDRILQQIALASQINVRLEYNYLFSPFCRKLLSLASPLDVKYYMKDLTLLPHVEVSTCVDDALNLIDLYCIIFNYWSVHEEDYGSKNIVKFIEMILAAWRKYSHDLIQESLVDNSVVFCDAMEQILFIISDELDRKQSISFSVEWEQTYVKALLLSIWQAVMKAGSRNYHMSQLTVLRFIKIICDSFNTLFSKPREDSNRQLQLMQYIFKMIQPNAIKGKKKDDMVHVIKDTMWVLANVHPSLEREVSSVQDYFRVLIQYLLAYAPPINESSPNNFLSDILYSLNTDETIERKDMVMVKRVRCDEEIIPVVTPSNTIHVQNPSHAISGGNDNSSNKKPPKLSLFRVSESAQKQYLIDEAHDSFVSSGEFDDRFCTMDDERNPANSNVTNGKSFCIVRGNPVNSSKINEQLSRMNKRIKKEFDTGNGEVQEIERSYDKDEDDDEVRIVSKNVGKRKSGSIQTGPSSSCSSKSAAEKLKANNILLKKKMDSDINNASSAALIDQTLMKRAMLIEKLLDDDNDVIEIGLKMALEMCDSQDGISLLQSNTAFFKALKIFVNDDEKSSQEKLVRILTDIILKFMQADVEITIGMVLKYQIALLLAIQHMKLLVTASMGNSTFVRFMLAINHDAGKEDVAIKLEEKLQNNQGILVHYFQSILSAEKLSSSHLVENVKLVSQWIEAITKLEGGKDFLHQCHMKATLLQCLHDTTIIMQGSIDAYLNVIPTICSALAYVE